MNLNTCCIYTCLFPNWKNVGTFSRRFIIMSAALIFLLLTATLSAPVQADSATPKVYGKTIGNWGHAWWQWLLNFPKEEIPTSGTGNVDCSAGQSGEVWFLVGTFNATADRTCTIKRGKALFFPLLNSVYIAPEDCSDVLGCRTGVSKNRDKISSWTCTVDNVPCAWFTQVVRAQSDPLPINIPPGSIGETVDWGYAQGLHRTSVADGYYVMLNPLPPGEHTVHFTSAFPPSFNLDVIYHLTVSSLTY